MNIVLGKSEGKNVSLDVDKFLSTRLLVQANSGKGKSHLLRRIAEQFFGKVQVIIIDPEGEFATLREKYGYVLVGKGGETPADPRSAALVAHKLLELRASAVCDLYEMKPTARHEWVQKFLDAMTDAPKNLWHPCVVIVDEAHVFCPEKGAGESIASEAMIGLATRGRKRGFACIFATQRLGKLRKDAAAELTNVMIGGTFIDVDRKRAADALGFYSADLHKFFDDIKVMERGYFYALGPAIALDRTLVHVGDVETTHPEAGSAKHGAEPPPPPEAIAKLLPKLSDLPKAAEEKAKTEAELRKEIRDLKAHLRTQPTVAREVRVADPKAIERAVREAKASFVRAIEERDRCIASIRGAAGKICNDLAALTNLPLPAEVPKVSAGEIQTKEIPRVRTGVASSPTRVIHPRPEIPHENNGHLPEGEREILKAIAKYADGVKRDQLSVLTGYKRSTRDAYIARLRPKGYIDERGGVIMATDTGIAALGNDYEQFPPGGDELKEYWLRRLPDGEKKLLEILLEHSEGVDREALTEATGYKRSTRDAYLARMAAKKIIDSTRNGVKAVGEFWG
jgi:hypothetical protein